MTIAKLFSLLDVVNKTSCTLLNLSETSTTFFFKEFAANAVGDVHVFLPKEIGALSIFWNIEPI
ncbi:hypothetical protein [Microseira wollei]|uniref:hypothetical protein n=1 Tax=Microseira wollei TaxID=467598 RepID=UPI001CFCEA70|nr:hypothetical protein [Microseira wollei]